jgi:hypothetical protein
MFTVDAADSLLQMRLITHELVSDFASSHDGVIKNDSPFWRRTLVRTLFAGIEGISYRLKQVAFIVAEYHSIELSKAEKALISEESYDLTDKGEAIIKKAKLRTAENLLFSLKIAARSAHSTCEVDKNSEGWKAFKEASKIRDRITHPKNLQDLNVSDSELDVIRTAASWFSIYTRDMIIVMQNSLYIVDPKI